jgi:hypothetical protein
VKHATEKVPCWRCDGAGVIETLGTAAAPVLDPPSVLVECRHCRGERQIEEDAEQFLDRVVTQFEGDWRELAIQLLRWTDRNWDGADHETRDAIAEHLQRDAERRSLEIASRTRLTMDVEGGDKRAVAELQHAL